ncbi:uncharacterized protein RAG0_00808 [Rhynchosporium agropyri]|uniref:RING-type domain-containing protein n=1 Tax=Rhynchosporium agropyri TaxID=914238 RepID=A0A1E1JU34_9HELO|nr:uncharacterized protein RAG0_00808 [Rhynchosporium agropyri]
MERNYVVEHCMTCLFWYVESLSPGEAADLQSAFIRKPVVLGENPQIMNPGFHQPLQMASLAGDARRAQIFYESNKRTRTQRNLEILKANSDKQARYRQWFQDYNDYLRSLGADQERPFIVEVSKRRTTINNFFREARSPFQDSTCTICQEDLEPEVVGADQLTVNMARFIACGHIFHHACIESWLCSDGNPRCPICRREYSIVCNYGYDDPVQRFFPADRIYRQVSGYIPFPRNGRGGKGITHIAPILGEPNNLDSDIFLH